jgi:hypothetical protein
MCSIPHDLADNRTIVDTVTGASTAATTTAATSITAATRTTYCTTVDVTAVAITETDAR